MVKHPNKKKELTPRQALEQIGNTYTQVGMKMKQLNKAAYRALEKLVEESEK